MGQDLERPRWQELSVKSVFRFEDGDWAVLTRRIQIMITTCLVDLGARYSVYWFHAAELPEVMGLAARTWTAFVQQRARNLFPSRWVLRRMIAVIRRDSYPRSRGANSWFLSTAFLFVSVRPSIAGTVYNVQHTLVLMYSNRRRWKKVLSPRLAHIGADIGTKLALTPFEASRPSSSPWIPV